MENDAPPTTERARVKRGYSLVCNKWQLGLDFDCGGKTQNIPMFTQGCALSGQFAWSTVQKWLERTISV